MPMVSLVIVHWQGKERLLRCLDALRHDAGRSEAGRDRIEVVLVANGPEAKANLDDPAVVATWPERTLVWLEANRGFAAGANAGIARARGRWISTLNDDTEVESGFLETLLAAAEAADPRCGMLQPCMVEAEGSNRIDSTGIAIRRGASIEDRDRGQLRGDEAGGREVFCASAGAAWYRREMLEDIARRGEVFDPDYYMYFEDVDLGWRSRLAGWQAVYVPEAIVRHGRHASASAKPPGFVRSQCMQNRLRVVLANGSKRFVVAALPRLAKDVGGLVLDRGWRGGCDAVRSVSSGLAARRVASPAERAARASVEREWFGLP